MKNKFLIYLFGMYAIGSFVFFVVIEALDILTTANISNDLVKIVDFNVVIALCLVFVAVGLQVVRLLIMKDKFDGEGEQ